jgi:hypothetical protein
LTIPDVVIFSPPTQRSIHGDHTMTYWLDLFSGVTWNEFRKAGSKIIGFRETRWTTVQKIKEGLSMLPDRDLAFGRLLRLRANHSGMRR